MEFQALKAMFTEAREERYPESELLEALQLTVEEADKCQMVAQQLCSSQGKVRTRGADTKYRLTVEELQLFANQLETLPAKVAGHTGVSGLLAQVAQFQVEASRLLEAETVELEVVERCLEKGEGLEIELVEVGQLRAKAEQLAWMEEMTELLSEPGEVRCLWSRLASKLLLFGQHELF